MSLLVMAAAVAMETGEYCAEARVFEEGTILGSDPLSCFPGPPVRPKVPQG